MPVGLFDQLFIGGSIGSLCYESMIMSDPGLLLVVPWLKKMMEEILFIKNYEKHVLKLN